jgi:hypothetical protein
MPDKSRGRSQRKRDTLVLQGRGLCVRLKPHNVNTKLFRNKTVASDGGKKNREEWRQILQEGKAHPGL